MDLRPESREVVLNKGASDSRLPCCFKRRVTTRPSRSSMMCDFEQAETLNTVKNRMRKRSNLTNRHRIPHSGVDDTYGT